MATDPEEIKLLMQSMRRELILHDHLYYGRDAPVITDRVYDNMMKELERLEENYEFMVKIPSDSPTQVPGSDRFK
jgi:DNA ligase (NAD+)